MSDSLYIFDVTQNDFPKIVLENSYRLPVLVDFWAAWCQPCQLLMPLLKRLVDQSEGAFILAKVNADEEQALAAQFRVRGLPTVKVFRNGQVVDELMGVQPESVYVEVIERHRTKTSDRLREQAETAWQRGEHKQALKLLRKARSLEPDNSDLKIALAEKLLAEGDSESARELLEELPLELQTTEPASGLVARLNFTAMAKRAPDMVTLEAALRANPNDLAAHYSLATRKVAEENYEAALEQFLEILRRDPKFNDEAGRKGLLAVFDILGDGHPLVTNYRRQMFTLLH